MDNYYVLIGMIIVIVFGLNSAWNINKHFAKYNESKSNMESSNVYLRIIITDITLILTGLFVFIMLFIKALDVL